MLAGATDESIINVIKHECAHYVTTLMYNGEVHGHDSEFKKVAAMLGSEFLTASADLDWKEDASQIKAAVTEAPAKYIIRCACCGEIIGKRKRACKVTKYPMLFKSKCCNDNIYIEEVQ